jgi:Zn-dependent protease
MEQITNWLVRIPAILLALTIHEFAHGYMALLRGDATAKNAGRLTLNPLSHLDIMGTLMLFVGPFGWAKPVPVTFHRLRNPRRDSVLVGAAGPIANVLLALMLGFALRLIMNINPNLDDSNWNFITYFLWLSFRINLGLSFFNLIPVPPLDGSHILLGFLSREQAESYLKWTQYAPMVFIGLITLEWLVHIPIFSAIINPLWMPYFAFWKMLVFG